MDTATYGGLLLATTSEIEGRPVREYFGIVIGEATMKAPPPPVRAEGRAGHRRARSPTFEQRVRETRDLAIAAMVARAASLGATAVIAVAIDYASIPAATGDDLLVIAASGTAVLL